MWVSGRCCVPLFNNGKPIFFVWFSGSAQSASKTNCFQFSLGSKGRYFRRVIIFWEDILMSDLCNWKERWSSGWTEVGRMFKVCKMFYWGGVGWDNFDKNCDLNCTLEKKGLCIDVTKGEDHTGLRKIYLERSGPKLKKIQARLELPTPASSTPEISVVAPRDCGVAFYSEVASASLGVNSILIAEQKLKVSISPLF